MNVQLVRICNPNTLNINICNAKRTSCLLFYRIANPAEQVLKEIQKIPQPKHLPKLRIANSNLTLGI